MARPKKGASTMPAPTEVSPGQFGVWKPLDQEFSLDGDFAAIAADLGVSIDQVSYSITSEVKNDIDGHTLKGVLAS